MATLSEIITDIRNQFPYSFASITALNPEVTQFYMYVPIDFNIQEDTIELHLKLFQNGNILEVSGKLWDKNILVREWTK
jgi:hypothetical protein